MRFRLAAVAPITFALPAQADPLAGIIIEPESDATYSRSMYGGWRDYEDLKPSVSMDFAPFGRQGREKSLAVLQVC